MTLVEAIDAFDRELQKDRSEASQSIRESILLLKQYLSSTPATCTKLEAPVVRDFLARWCSERSGTNQVPSPEILLTSIESFLNWLGRSDSEFTRLLDELSRTLPRAVEITAALSHHLALRGGAFSFPEFLTTFAEGGQSQYDIDIAGEGGGPGAIEGYFKVLRVEGSSAEVEEMISEERVWPLLLPDEVARLIEPGYIVNLEIIRNPEGWSISACGFAYPPGTTV